MASILGIDEARKGPVIGSMVICGVLIEENQENELKKIGVKDSKLLTRKKRENLFPKILKIIKKHKAIMVSPKEIDNAINSNELNLNRLEAIKTALIINELKPDKVILDCPSVNIKSYVTYLKLFLKNKELKIIAEHKAERYPIVAAASVLAKVIGDEQLNKLKKRLGVDFGSGYPSDPYTIKFLKENYLKYPKIFRKSWSTYKKIANQKKLDEY